MNMLEVHSAALDKSVSPYHDFLLSYKAVDRIVFGFVEGKEDPAFYRGLIESMLPRTWRVRLIRAGNRDAVLTLRDNMDWDRFPPSRVCFFIDRDLSIFLDCPEIEEGNLYITDDYSIESDIVSVYVFERVVQELLNISDISTSELDLVCALFEENVTAFSAAMIPIMAQILIWRRSRLRPALNNLDLDALFSFVNGKLHLAGGLESEMSRVAHAAQCFGLDSSPEVTVKQAITELRSEGADRRFVRGKYLLWFFVNAALALHSAIPAYCVGHPKPPRLHVTFGPGNAMPLIAPRARMPDSLRQFVSRTYLDYIKNFNRD